MRFLRCKIDIAPFGALIDPGAQDSDVFRRQRTGWRHLHSTVSAYQPQDQLALGALAGDDDGAVVATAQSVLPLVEPKSRLLLFGAVAGVTLCGQNRLHVLIKVHLHVGGGWQLAAKERYQWQG